jgi:hypothetical protein
VKCQQDNAFYNTMKAKYVPTEGNINNQVTMKETIENSN